MKKTFSTAWKSSKAPRKQRKYIAKAPLHIKRKFLSAHLSKELIKKYHRRSLPIRTGDIVKVARGQFKKTKGKITSLNLKKTKAYIENIHITKKDGTKALYPIHPSNLIIQDLNLDDKERKKILDRKKVEEKKK